MPRNLKFSGTPPFETPNAIKVVCLGRIRNCHNMPEGLSHISLSLSIYIYIYAVELLAGPSLGVFKVINRAKSKLLTGPRSFLHYKNRGFRRSCFCSVIVVWVFWCPIIWQFFKNCLFQKQGAIFFDFLCFKFKFWISLLLALLKH